jgi:RNA ligase (TIGR02306 family)
VRRLRPLLFRLSILENPVSTPKLAVVGLIQNLEPIAGADRIQRADVVCGSAGKWSGVVSLEIALGDTVTVFLQDALLPPDPRWAFMERHHWRVRMARFKGVPSECVIIPGAPDLPVGTDLSQALGVTKYERPMPPALAGDMAGAFPSFIPKTDEPNFQTERDLDQVMASGDWYVTEKADGTSCTAWNDETGLRVCSRNWELRELNASGAGNVYWQAARQYGLDRLPSGLALQFEIVGPGIQGNLMGLAMREIRAFTLRSTANGQRLPVLDLADHCEQLDLPMARILQRGSGPRSADTLREMAQIKYANGKPGKGVVIRALDSNWSYKSLNLLYKD